MSTAKSATEPAVLLQVTDPHLHANAASRMRGVNTYDTFLAVLDDAQRASQWPPDAIIATGDLVQDESREGYERFKACLADRGIPVLCIPGNHDDPEIMAELLDEPPFQCCGEAQVGAWRLIMLSTFVRSQDSGALGSKALAELNARLEARTTMPTMICMHHQPVAMGSAWLDGVGLRDGDRLMAIVDRHPQVRAIVWGHVHQASDSTHGNVRLLSAPSTCAQFLPNNPYFALDDRPPGYRWLKLYPDGTVQTSVAWLDAGR